MQSYYLFILCFVYKICLFFYDYPFDFIFIVLNNHQTVSKLSGFLFLTCRIK